MIPKKGKVSILALALAKKKYPEAYAAYSTLRDQALEKRRELIQATYKEAKALLAKKSSQSAS